MKNTGPAPKSSGGKRMPLVSIIIPCYNCRQYIAEAIESALAQTHPNVEIVVVDDGSIDGSPEIVKKYPIHFVQGSHQGVSVARNLGIEAGHGEFLVFLDSDDRLFPCAVAAGCALLERNPQCAMAVGAHYITTQDGKHVTTRRKPCQLRNSYELLLRSNFIECTSSVVFRRSCFEDGRGFKPNLRGAEDYEVYLRVARESPLCCHNEVVTEYRLHSTSASRQSAMMLSHTLEVVSEQWPFARRSLRGLLCYVAGSLSWRRKYGRQLTAEMATSEDQYSAREKRNAWWLLARSYPQGMIVVLASRLLPKSLVRSILQRA